MERNSSKYTISFELDTIKMIEKMCPKLNKDQNLFIYEAAEATALLEKLSSGLA